MWNPFAKRDYGQKPLVEWNGAAFPFQASAGHNYDLWAWPYPAQTNQYETFHNAWTGNQLPNFGVAVPIVRTQEQVNRPWFTSWNKQFQNAQQIGASGGSPLQFGQQQSADWISQLGQFWGEQSRGLGGGRLKK